VNVPVNLKEDEEEEEEVSFTRRGTSQYSTDTSSHGWSPALSAAAPAYPPAEWSRGGNHCLHAHTHIFETPV